MEVVAGNTQSHIKSVPEPMLWKNDITGKWISHRSQDNFLNISPAKSDDVVGNFPMTGRKDTLEYLYIDNSIYTLNE